MSRVEKIEKAIEALPEEEFEELRKWFRESQGEKWDKEIETDSRERNPRFLVREAEDARRYRETEDL